MPREEILECKRKSETEEKQIKQGCSRVKIKIKELKNFDADANMQQIQDQGRVVENLLQKILNFYGTYGVESMLLPHYQVP